MLAAINVFLQVMLATSKFAPLPPASLPSSLLPTLPSPEQWRCGSSPSPSSSPHPHRHRHHHDHNHHHHPIHHHHHHQLHHDTFWLCQVQAGSVLAEFSTASYPELATSSCQVEQHKILIIDALCQLFQCHQPQHSTLVKRVFSSEIFSKTFQQQTHIYFLIPTLILSSQCSLSQAWSLPYISVTFHRPQSQVTKYFHRHKLNFFSQHWTTYIRTLLYHFDLCPVDHDIIEPTILL